MAYTKYMTNSRYANRTIEARIWKVADYGNGPLVKLWLGQRDGDRQFRSLIPLSDADQSTWFNLTTNENAEIVGISI